MERKAAMSDDWDEVQARVAGRAEVWEAWVKTAINLVPIEIVEMWASNGWTLAAAVALQVGMPAAFMLKSAYITCVKDLQQQEEAYMQQLTAPAGEQYSLLPIMTATFPVQQPEQSARQIAVATWEDLMMEHKQRVVRVLEGNESVAAARERLTAEALHMLGAHWVEQHPNRPAHPAEIPRHLHKRIVDGGRPKRFKAGQ
jgi:hypothetical protein